MRRSESFCFVALFSAISVFASACGSTPGNTNLTAVNTNANLSNTLANSNLNTAITAGPTINTREPDQYQANIRLSLETMGPQQANVPTLGATVARSGSDRVMEFMLPNNEKVIYLDKAGTNYLILPNRRQYAELNQQSLGFEVRRLMMPAEIVDRVKNLQGVRFVGEETVNGRQVQKYAYEAVANTQTQAGNVETESFMLVDKETGLPLRTETVSQSQTGGNVQGVSGVRVVTEMTDIRPNPDPAMFTLPEGYSKIDAEQVRAQVNLVFNAVGMLIGQAMNQSARPPANANSSANMNMNANR